MRDIVLASSSPRRIEMMKSRGFDPIVKAADVDETLPCHISAKDAVLFLALKKALAVEKELLDDLKETDPCKAPLIIAADTVVYKEGMGIMGKPAHIDDARRMIKGIAGTGHKVATGTALLLCGRPVRKVIFDVTEVFVRDMTDEEIEDYLRTDEPYDKAGAYAIQGIFGKYIERYIGDFNTVVGFPIDHVIEEAEAMITGKPLK